MSALFGLAGLSLFLWGLADTLRQGADRCGPPIYAAYRAVGVAWFWLAAVALVGIAAYLDVKISMLRSVGTPQTRRRP